MRSLEALSTWPVGAASAGVVAGGERPDPATAFPDDPTPVPASAPSASVAGTWGDLDRKYPWASVTKLCTALSVLVAVEDGILTLDEHAGPPGATVAHLLAHASGLAPTGGGILARPAERRIYSNTGYELLGDLVATRAGLDFAAYLRASVLEPLGMMGARLPPAASPAAGMFGSVRDLMALGGELLSPTLVGRELWDRAISVAFPGLVGVLPGFGHQNPCDWGLGFEIHDGKRPHWMGRGNSPRAFGHFGRSGGFLWVDPAAGAACAVLTDTVFGPWATTAWPRLSDRVLEELRG